MTANLNNAQILNIQSKGFQSIKGDSGIALL